ncbi:MAG: AsmA-like C-terminal region-containing protein [Saprospiraceae bacterium]
MEVPPSYPPSPIRRSWLRRILLGLLFSVLGLLLLLVLIAAFFDKQVSQQLVAEINKNLKTELRVGEASLSLLSGFPAASVNLSQVRLKDALGGQLLAAQGLSFRFDLLSLFGDDLKIHSVRLQDGAIRIVVNRAGKSNTDIFKESKTPKKTSTESTLQLALENAELQNIAILYDNAPAQQAAEMVVGKASASGNFSARQFRLSSQADIKINYLDSDSSRYLGGQTLRYDAVLAVDLKRGAYALQNVELSLGGNTFNVEGLAVVKPEGTDLNFKLVGQEGDVSMIANLMPGAYHAYFREFQSTGNYACSGTVKGRLSKTETPAIRFEVALRDGKMSSEKLQGPLRNVSFRARYNAQPDGSGEFELADFKGDFGGQPLSLSLKVNQLEDPIVEFQANGALPLDAAYGLFDNDLITAGDGIVRLNRLKVQGRYADMTSMRRISLVNASGEIQFDNAAITYNKTPLLAETGFLRLEDNEFRLDSFVLRAGKSDFLLDGSAKNLLPVLFADSLNTAGALLEFGARLRSENFDVDQIIGMFSVQSSASEAGGEAGLDSLKKEKNTKRSLAMNKLKGTFEANIRGFKYGKIEGKNFLGSFEFDHNNLNFNGNAAAMQGELALQGNARFDLAASLKMHIVARNLDLQTMLAQCENFGQEVITAENMRGRLSGRVVLWTYWNDFGEFDMKRLRALADVQATNGELQKVKMFEDFSSFVHLEDLRRIRFTDLQNYLEIKDQRLYLPVMFLQSNALNMTLSGEHTFDNDIDYKIKINAGQVLLNRLKKHDSDLDPLPEKKGGFNLYYSIVGNLDKYEMKRKKRAVKAEFERSEARKLLIAKALDAEFGGASVDVMLYTPTQIENDGEEYLEEMQGGGKQ